MPNNRLHGIVGKLQRLPLSSHVTSAVLGRVVPFVGTADIAFLRASPEEVVCRIRNKRKVRNHIRGVHAAATALLAETATGIVVGLNLPDDKLPLLKSMNIRYVKRAKGDLKATARLPDGAVERMRADPKGDVLVLVEVRDAADNEPVICEMTWAWVPKKRG